MTEHPLLAPALWRVVGVRVLGVYRLGVRFSDGTEGTVDMAPLLTSPGAGVFATLCDPAVFDRAHVVMGVVTWPGGLDLAPDAMHAAIRRDGIWHP